MSDERQNPYRDARPFWEVALGGALLRSYLVEIDGLKVEDEWQVNKPTSMSGAGLVFRGTKIPGGDGGVTLTLEAPDEASFDDLYALWDLMAPKPGSFSPSAASSGASKTSAVGVPSYSEAPSGGGSSSSGASSYTVPTGDGAPKGGAGGDVGPRPPTLTIDNALLSFHGIKAVARRSWEGPIPTDTCSWRVKIALIVDNPPTPAGVGQAQPPKASTSPGAQYVEAGTDASGQRPEAAPGGAATGV